MELPRQVRQGLREAGPLCEPQTLSSIIESLIQPAQAPKVPMETASLRWACNALMATFVEAAKHGTTGDELYEFLSPLLDGKEEKRQLVQAYEGAVDRIRAALMTIGSRPPRLVGHSYRIAHAQIENEVVKPLDDVRLDIALQLQRYDDFTPVRFVCNEVELHALLDRVREAVRYAEDCAK